MEELPSISVGVLTYKRRYWLEETIHYFLNQTYKGNKEMVILNDDPEVKYVYNHPEVRIYNWKYRFHTINQKENQANAFCKNELFTSWADDDIHEAWELETAVRYLGDKRFTACAPFWKEFGDRHKTLSEKPTATMYIIKKDFWNEIGDIPVSVIRSLWVRDNAKILGVYNISKLEKDEIYFTWRTWSKKHYGAYFKIDNTDSIEPETCYLEPGIRTGLLE